MLLIPSRADCIIFCVDDVLTTSDGVIAALSRTLFRSLGLSEEDGSLDIPRYFAAARCSGLFSSFGDMAWALRSCVEQNSEGQYRVPSLAEWEKHLKSAADRKSLEYFAGLSSVNRSEIANLFSEQYLGSKRNQENALYHQDKPLVSFRWDRGRFPVGVCTSRTKAELSASLVNLGWQDLPRNHAVTSDDISKTKKEALSSLCNALGGEYPLFIGSAPQDLALANAFGRCDFITVGSLFHSDSHFSTAADALRAILGVI